MDPPTIKEGLSEEVTVVLDDGIRGGGGRVGRVTGSRVPSAKEVIT